MWRIGCLAPRSQLRNTRVSAAGRPRGEAQAPRGLPGPLDSVKDGVTTENRGDIPGRTCLAAAAAPTAQSKDDDRESSLLPWPRSGVPPRCQGSPRSPGVGGLTTRALLVSTRRLWGKAAEPSPDTAWEAAHQPLGPKVPPGQGRGAGARGSARRDGSRPPRVQQAAPRGQEGPAPPVPAPHSSQGPLPAARHRPRSAPRSSLMRGHSPCTHTLAFAPQPRRPLFPAPALWPAVPAPTAGHRPRLRGRGAPNDFASRVRASWCPRGRASGAGDGPLHLKPRAVGKRPEPGRLAPGRPRFTPSCS